MLIYSQERYYPTLVNTIVLQTEVGYFYVHRDTYDQAVILSDHYTTLDISQLLTSPANMDACTEVEKILPEPLRIFAPFLCMVDEGIDKTNIEDMIGALHIITSAINMRNLLKMQKQVMNSCKFSLHVLEEYKLSWENFFVSFGSNQMIATPVKEVVKQVIKEEQAPAPMTYNAEDNTINIVDDDEDLDELMKALDEANELEELEEAEKVAPVVKETSSGPVSVLKKWGV